MRGEECVEELLQALRALWMLRVAAVDRRAPQPSVDRILERRHVGELALHPLERGRGLPAVRLQCGEVARALAVLGAECDPLRLRQPEQDLDLPQLRALESAGGNQLVAK